MYFLKFLQHNLKWYFLNSISVELKLGMMGGEKVKVLSLRPNFFPLVTFRTYHGVVKA